ncbi:MAG: methanethiol S-methyltransferase [Myxococcota bacterium]
MKRWIFLAYGVSCHVLFLVTYALMAGFVGGFDIVWAIDAPPTSASLPQALAIDGALLLLFAAQHSIMARPGFKRVWTRIVPEPIERSTYVLISNLLLVVLMALWQPIDAIVWNVEHPVGHMLLWALFGAGWLMVPLVSLMIDHFDLFGTRQVWLHWEGREYQPLPFHTRALYRSIRHPLYVGWALAFWATPTMTAGHLLFAAALTGYMALAVRIEERDLVRFFGSVYEEYRERVPMFVPRISLRAMVSGRNHSADAASPSGMR